MTKQNEKVRNSEQLKEKIVGTGSAWQRKYNMRMKEKK